MFEESFKYSLFQLTGLDWVAKPGTCQEPEASKGDITQLTLQFSVNLEHLKTTGSCMIYFSVCIPQRFQVRLLSLCPTFIFQWKKVNQKSERLMEGVLLALPVLQNGWLHLEFQRRN